MVATRFKIFDTAKSINGEYILGSLTQTMLLY